MSVLLPAYETQLDRATGKLGVTKINPMQTFMSMDSMGIHSYSYQFGEWFAGAEAGAPSCDASIVPEEYRKLVQKYPVQAEHTGANVVEACKYCNEKMNASALKDHIIGHMDEFMKGAGRPSEKVKA